jgi:hypothetical protein
VQLAASTLNVLFKDASGLRGSTNRHE